MSFKCLHIADVHFRGLSRHEEYKESFIDLIKQAKKLKPDVIYIGGDIVHSKTQGISPELIDILSWWFTSLAEVAPTHVILGNHDGLINNKDRQDAISPIITALDDPNVFLYKKSGVYPTGIPGYNWCVFSCFDEESWNDLEPVSGEVNIALYHGAVCGSLTDINWNIDGEIEASFFEGYDFAFLGDIHKMQYLDPDKRIAYCGSTIQQNYGEDPGKGFLFWEIDGKDTYSSSFHEVKHTRPFITIEWKGNVQSTLDEAEVGPDGSRYRIRAKTPVPQAEIKQLHSALKEFKLASEIVWKHDYESEAGVISTPEGEILTEDLRDPKTHVGLMKQYYSSLELTDDEWLELESLAQGYVSAVNKEGEVLRNAKWSIKKMQFDNTFSYGKGNVINFDNLSGITGLFGRNRIGKSSIPGTLMYTLFNTTDRGPIKNLHVINSRKGHCLSKVDVSINGVLYRIERQSVKHQNRKGIVNATTHLNLFRIDSEGNEIQDMSGEQRRETEKILRKLIGTSDDFLMTSLASQGEMNTFIKHRATARKEILTNFLDLGIFEQMYNLAKLDSAEIKALLKAAPDREWDTVLDEKKRMKILKIQKRDELEKKIKTLRSRMQSLKITLATHKDKDTVTSADVELFENKLEAAREELEEYRAKKGDVNVELDSIDEKISKISVLKQQFPIDELKERLAAQQDLERTLVNLKHEHEKEKSTLKIQERSVKKLLEVPCGDSYPTCKFIKDSHKNKRLITAQKDRCTDVLDQVRAAKKSLKVLQSEGLSEKISKYDSILVQESNLKVEKSDATVKLHGYETSILSSEASVESMTRELADMKVRVSDNGGSHEIAALKRSIADLNVEINSSDAGRLALSESIGLLTSAIQNLEDEKEKYSALLKKWRIYELFMGAVSKKGIPLQIIASQLPLINQEISKILQGVVGFTVELEADANSNAMDVYINYGDSRRIIECGSGMEKLVSSMAIRVALINISSLPKSDMLIIDEGFGALDEMNVEASNRLLKSLKKWFKNILVISHVDAVKDSVDNVLDITSKEKNARVVFE